MSGINKVILVGHLGRDPEAKTVGSGTSMCGLSLATSRTWSDKSGQRQEKTTWHRVVAWEKAADYCSRYLKKGDLIYVEGSLETREYESDGQKKMLTEVKAQRVEGLSKKSDGGSASAPTRDDHHRPPHGRSDGGRASWGPDLRGDDVPF